MATVESPDYAPLEQAINQLRQHNCDLEKFIDQLLHEIASLGQEVETRATELLKARKDLERSSEVSTQSAEENLRLSRQVHEKQEALQRAQNEVEQLRQQLTTAQSSSGDQSSQQRIAELEQQLSASQSGTADESQLLTEVENLRRELAAAKLELMRKEQSDDQSQPPDEIGSLVEKNQALEGELHQARGHAMQLTETIDQQQKELNQQKHAWAEELQAMRSLLERRGSNPSQTPQPQSFADTSVISETATVCRDEIEYRANNNNTVVDSVMAQFAKLQRDVNKRRTQRS
ncbi:hypothetical protein GC197_09555 [bacterium]|nr:hypothetical protein [bacterium]